MAEQYSIMSVPHFSPFIIQWLLGHFYFLAARISVAVDMRGPVIFDFRFLFPKIHTQRWDCWIIW